MKLAICALLVTSTIAAAAPKPTLVNVEVERDALGYQSFLSQLPAAEVEPGGLLVPQQPGAHWLAMGLKPGDVIRYFDGTPAADRIMVRDGVNVFEIVRNGKPIVLRVLVHSPSTETSTLRETDFQDVLKRIVGPDPHSTVVKNKAGAITGVRVTNMLLGFSVELSVGDIVRTIDGKPIRSDAELVAALQTLRVGRTDIVVERYGRTVTIELTRLAPSDFSKIKKLATNRYEVPRAIADAIDNDIWLLTRNIETVRVVAKSEVRGVRIYNIANDSLVAALGFLNDDIILDVEGRPVATLEEALAVARDLTSAATIVVNVQRDGRKVPITFVIK
jgi:S1-C subfamily serine protease